MKDSAFPVFSQITQAAELLDDYGDECPKARYARLILEDVLDLLRKERLKDRQEKRDYFAGQALAGLCSDWLNMPDAVTLPEGVSRAEAVAECAYQIADAMIAERERP